MAKTFLITGGAGFIGSAVVRELINDTPHHVVNFDKLTYAGNLESVAEVASSPRYTFIHADVADANAVERAFAEYRPDVVMHLAAESHVDRSIDGPGAFVHTNLVGTYTLLETARLYWKELRDEDPDRAAGFRFHHVSTDEVYGDLDAHGEPFTEDTAYAPSSPYSASKAGADHLVRAWQRTYGLPTIITNCSNNYGPYHFPEKLIPLMIGNALSGRALPVYGDGRQVRDWLYVADHARALVGVAALGVPGETYNIGGRSERTNLEVVETLCARLEEAAPDKPAGINAYRDLIQFVADRPGHDRRYAIDTTKIERELGWSPRETFESGLKKTVEWFLENPGWWQRMLASREAGERLGVNT